MFSPAQEVELGDVLAEVVRASASELDDPELSAYLQQLGDRLASNLPPSGLKFRFYLSNEPVSNAFSIAGGRVYVTRKMIGFVHSEDELASVLTHELGHIVTHQTAIDYTRFFNSIGITEISDRADIEAEFHRLLESNKHFHASEESRQLEADRVGLELLALSGYRVDAAAEFFDRATDNRGKTGSWFSELFGTTPEDSKRLREIQKSLHTFPPECVQHVAQTGTAFREWQSRVVAFNGSGRKENLPGLITRKPLEPPLQDDIHTLRFSYDGKYLLAQDDGSIYVLTREPLAFKFRIDAPEAYPATFTWDSKQITFYDPSLHVEVWNADTGSREDVYEAVSYRGCLQTALSPDGKTLACVDAKETMILFDTATDERVFEKKDIRQGQVGIRSGISSFSISYTINFLNMEFSPDGHYLVVAGDDVALAIDVPGRHEVPIAGPIKPYLHGAFTFTGDRTLVGNEKNGSRAAVITFPDGPILKQIDLGSSVPFPVAKGNYVLMRPIKDYEVGVLDIASNNITRASKTPALDLYGDIAASMLVSGEVGLFGNSSTPLARVELPRGHFGPLRAANFSDDTNWLAVSTRTRGSIWNLSSGTRAYNLKGFRGACFADGNLYMDFPKQEKVDRSIVRAGLEKPGLSIMEKVDPGRAWQSCEYLVSLRRKEESKKDSDKSRDDSEEDGHDFRFHGTRAAWRDVFESADTNKIFEVRDVRTGTLLWSRTFDKEIPAIHTDSVAGVAAFRWRLHADGAKAELKRLSDVVRSPQAGHDNDYLIEVVNLSSGKILKSIVVDSANGAYSIRRHLATSDWLVTYDSFGRTLVHSLKTGQCTDRLFGRPVSLSPTGSLVVEHGSGRLSIYDLASAQKTRELTFPFPVSVASFTRDGKKLQLVTNDQVAYTIDASSSK